ncbi:MAG: hypothetical protein LC748_03540 [Thermomicrobia bacterium]|nr:hypothetical protein [Thermomicrobia bacterium]
MEVHRQIELLTLLGLELDPYHDAAIHGRALALVRPFRVHARQMTACVYLDADQMGKIGPMARNGSTRSNGYRSQADINSPRLGKVVV